MVLRGERFTFVAVSCSTLHAIAYSEPHHCSVTDSRIHSYDEMNLERRGCDGGGGSETRTGETEHGTDTLEGTGGDARLGVSGGTSGGGTVAHETGTRLEDTLDGGTGDRGGDGGADEGEDGGNLGNHFLRFEEVFEKINN